MKPFKRKEKCVLLFVDPTRVKQSDLKDVKSIAIVVLIHGLEHPYYRIEKV